MGCTIEVVGALVIFSVGELTVMQVGGALTTQMRYAGARSGMVDSAGLRWDVLSDPDVPVEFENTLPNFGSIPADSFPIVRYTGWVFASFTGRGVLIGDGVFDPGSSFEWHGIVLAKHVGDVIQGHLDGLLVAGMEEPNMYATVAYRTESHYHSCDVYAANETLSYLERLENTTVDVN
jgi:hypothetical protein